MINKEPIDISMEDYRVYIFSNGDEFCIMKPLKLFISDSGGHRVVTEKECYIIKNNWLAIKISKESLRF